MRTPVLAAIFCVLLSFSIRADDLNECQRMISSQSDVITFHLHEMLHPNAAKWLFKNEMRTLDVAPDAIRVGGTLFSRSSGDLIYRRPLLNHIVLIQLTPRPQRRMRQFDIVLVDSEAAQISYTEGARSVPVALFSRRILNLPSPDVAQSTQN